MKEYSKGIYEKFRKRTEAWKKWNRNSEVLSFLLKEMLRHDRITV